MTESEKVYCDKCGEEMVALDAEQEIGMTCPHCGWGWVTSFSEAYESDVTDYSIVISANTASMNNVKIISEYAKVNYVQAKKLIDMPEAVIFVGKASEIIGVKEELLKNNINFKILPDFPY